MTATDTNGTSSFGQQWRTGSASEEDVLFSYDVMLHGQLVTVKRYKVPEHVWIPALSLKDRMNLSERA